MKGDRVKCFLLEELDLERVEVEIREGGECPKRKGGGHFAVARLAEGKVDEHRNLIDFDKRELWPAACACGFAFTEKAYRSGSYPRVYRRVDTGALMTTDEAPAGAIWRSTWYEENYPEYRGPDGRTYIAKCPGGSQWVIDSRANNCTSPCKHCGQPYFAHHRRKEHPKACEKYEDARPHKCWVRAGVAPLLSVTKGKPGESCKAGAGSILTSNYHGHLRNGEFVSC